MEPYDKQRKDNPGENWPKGSAAMIPGLILVGIGGLFLLNNLHIVHVSTWFAYWPVILIAVGLVKLVDSTFTAGRIAGGVLLAMGGLFLADNLGYIRIEEMWPLILIAIGIFMLWNRMRPGYDYGQWWGHSMRATSWARERFQHHRFPYNMSSFGGNSVNEVNVFSGTRRVITDQDFRGGKISCVFGGITLDLTGANIAGKSAILIVSAVYGGAVVRIPLNWDLEMRGAGVFGGYTDQTMHPPITSETKKLIVKGGAVFGGVTFKN
jgi:hypothetical protein